MVTLQRRPDLGADLLDRGEQGADALSDEIAVIGEDDPQHAHGAGS
jgi:hypothetical protein